MSDKKLQKPVFVPSDEKPWVSTVGVEVTKTFVEPHLIPAYIHEWHQASGLDPVLECSTRSVSSVGKSLSAHNLYFQTPSGRNISVEAGYQGSKVFQHGGPYHDIYNLDPKAAKTDRRLKNSGKIVGFNFFGREFGLANPQNGFFNWLYLSTLVRRFPSILKRLNKEYAGFTDFYRAWGEDRACQAEAVAMAVSLEKAGLFTKEFIAERLLAELSE